MGFKKLKNLAPVILHSHWPNLNREVGLVEKNPRWYGDNFWVDFLRKSTIVEQKNDNLLANLPETSRPREQHGVCSTSFELDPEVSSATNSPKTAKIGH